MTLAVLGPALTLLVAPPAQAQSASAPVTASDPALPIGDAPAVAPARVQVAVTTPVNAPPTAPRFHHASGDPFERVNRYFFRQHQKFDHALLRPAAMAYKHVLPKPLRAGLRHFFSNLREPFVFVNYLLQLKPGKAAETLARFVINSTYGIGGLLDVANLPSIHLPHRPNGFGDTLGFYGVKPGPYIFLPLFGPTTLRDLFGGAAEGLALPKLSVTPFDTPEYQVTRNVTSGLDVRAQADADLSALLDGAVDPYATFRSAFLQDRAGEIAALHGPVRDAAPAAELGDPLADPAGGTASPAPANTPELKDPLTDPAAGASPPPPPPSDDEAFSVPSPSPAKAGAQ